MRYSRRFRSILAAAGVVAFAFFVLHFSVQAQTWNFINPFTRSSDAVSLICAVSSAVRTLAIPLAVIAIIFVGFQFVVAASTGDRGNLQKLKTVLVWVLVGTIIIVAATVIINATVNFLSEIGSDTGGATQCSLF